MGPLSGKVALVTGGGAGIGQSIVLALAQEGADLAIGDIDSAAAQAVARTVSEYGRRAVAVTADCGDVPSIHSMLATAVTELGRVDILVNNAGLTRTAGLLDVTEEDWDRINRVNAKGVFFCLQAAARQMIHQGGGGRIINIASISGRGHKRSSSPAYAASKGAVISLTKVAAQQLGVHDINVNAICPGPTRTELVDQIMASRAASSGTTIDQIYADAKALIPLGRVNEPEDVAAMAVFLASPGARNITGQCYNVDGGLVMS